MDRNELLNDPVEAMRVIQSGFQADNWVALPGYIIDVNWSEMSCSVQTTIKCPINLEDGGIQWVDLPPLVKVPIVFPSGGGFTLTFPLVANDEVLVVWASRAIDAWWQQGGSQQPVEARMQDLSDGFAIPGPKSVPKVPGGISSSSVRLMKNNGSSPPTTYVELTASGRINLVAADGVYINGIHFDTHVHGGVETGGSNTGGPS